LKIEKSLLLFLSKKYNKINGNLIIFFIADKNIFKYNLPIIYLSSGMQSACRMIFRVIILMLAVLHRLSVNVLLPYLMAVALYDVSWFFT